MSDPAGQPIERRVRRLIDENLDAIRSDRTAHELRLTRLLPDLHAVRSFVFALARRKTRDCLRHGRCSTPARSSTPEVVQIFSDIHANLPALQAVLADIEQHGDICSVHLVHGSPRKVNQYPFEDKPASLYERLAAAEDANAMVFGRTHKPSTNTFGHVLFINSGSVGKPKDGDPRACCVELSAAAAAYLDVTDHRV